eukprot:gene25309-31750_t
MTQAQKHYLLKRKQHWSRQFSKKVDDITPLNVPLSSDKAPGQISGQKSNWSWSGNKCSCGEEWIAPMFQFVKSKTEGGVVKNFIQAVGEFMHNDDSQQGAISPMKPSASTDSIANEEIETVFPKFC